MTVEVFLLSRGRSTTASTTVPVDGILRVSRSRGCGFGTLSISTRTIPRDDSNGGICQVESRYASQRVWGNITHDYLTIREFRNSLGLICFPSFPDLCVQRGNIFYISGTVGLHGTTIGRGVVKIKILLFLSRLQRH